MSSTEGTVIGNAAQRTAAAGDDPVQFVDRYVQVGAITARYWAAGTGGTPVLLIHGFGASVQIWRPVLAALGQRHRVLAVDLPGFGRSGRPAASPTLGFMARFVREFLDAIGVARVALVGHSFGGGVALRFALDFPERLERLGLVGPAALGRRAHPLLLLMTLPGVGELLSLPSRAGTAMLFRLAMHNRDALGNAVIDEGYQLARLPGAQRSFLRTLRAAGHLLGQRRAFYRPILARLPEISAPTLVLWGRQDRIVPDASTAANAIPGARIEVWEECGHLPWIEHTHRFNALLLDFLAQDWRPGRSVLLL